MKTDDPNWNGQKKEEALRGLLQALSPREENGQTLFPAFKPDANGCTRGMIFAEEFADGKVPDDLVYLAGFQHTPLPVDHPDYLSSITYLDPFYNLPPSDQHDLQLCRERRQSAAAPSKATMSADPDIEILNIPGGGMILRTPKDEFPIANFSVYAKACRIVHGELRTDPVTEEYELTVCTHGQYFPVIIQPKDIPNIVSLIQMVNPSCSVSTSVRKVAAIIANHVRSQLFGLPVCHHIRRTGFIRLQGQWIYAHDGIRFPVPNLAFETRRTIGCDSSIPVPESCSIALSFLNISQKQELILPLFLMAHLAVLFNLFEAAGYASKYLTSYSAYVYVTSAGQVQVWFDVMGTGDMDEIGVLSVLLYESTDKSTWTRIKTFSHENYGTTMLAEDDWYVSSHVSTQGVKGRYYKAYICFWAGKNGSGDTRYMWTSVAS